MRTYRRKLTHTRSSQSGQAIVLIALAMIVLLGFMVLAIDGGKYYDQRRIAQNASDAASLAGLYLYQHPGASGNKNNIVLAAINDAAEKNGVPDSNGSAGDATNSNVGAYWINSSGDYVPNTSKTGCGSAVVTTGSGKIEPPDPCAQIINDSTLSKPTAATGVKVRAVINYTSLIAGFIGQPNLQVQADGTALITAGTITFGDDSTDRSIWTGGGSTCNTAANPSFGIGSDGPNNNEDLGSIFVNGTVSHMGSSVTNGWTGSISYTGSQSGSMPLGASSASAPSTNFPPYFYLTPGSLGSDASGNPIPPTTQLIQAYHFKPDDSYALVDTPNHAWKASVNAYVDVSDTGGTVSPVPTYALGSTNYIFQQYVSAQASGVAPARFYHYINHPGHENADLANMIGIGARGVFFIDGDITNFSTDTTVASGDGITVIANGKILVTGNNVDVGNAGTWGYNISLLAGGYPPAPSTNACAGDGNSANAIYSSGGQQVAWNAFLYVPNGMALVDGNNHHDPHGPVIAFSFALGLPGHPGNNINISSCSSCWSRPAYTMGLNQ